MLQHHQSMMYIMYNVGARIDLRQSITIESLVSAFELNISAAGGNEQTKHQRRAEQSYASNPRTLTRPSGSWGFGFHALGRGQPIPSSPLERGAPPDNTHGASDVTYIFPVQLTTSRIGNLTWLTLPLASCVTIHGYHRQISVVYIETLQSNLLWRMS